MSRREKRVESPAARADEGLKASPAIEERKPARSFRAPVIAAGVTVALVGSGLGGLTLNRVMAAGRTPSAVESVSVVIPAAAPAGPASEAAAADQMVEQWAAARPRLTRLPSVPDPFQPPPRSAVRVAVTAPAAAAEATGSEGPAGAAKAAARAAPKAPNAAPENAPKPEELAIVGLVQGDPPLAVVEYAGQQFYLKVGDQVADTWRLEEIKDRSATFRLGDQRVEVPINGGRSQ